MVKALPSSRTSCFSDLRIRVAAPAVRMRFVIAKLLAPPAGRRH